MNMFLRWIVIIVLIIITSHFAFSQQLMRDNLGSHIATKNLNMSGFNINAALNITATGTVNAATVIAPVVLAGTATAVSNSSIALQVDGTNKAILVPRVTDLLNATTPSIPVANAVNGMIVYDVATAKFYYRQNNAWVVYVDAVNYVDRFVPQVILGLKTMKSDSGFVAAGTFVGAATTVPTPIVGAGTRMMWYPAKAAFRAGTVPTTQWDIANVGIYSTAFGNSNISNASASFAIGFNNFASGANAFVAGNGNRSTGTESFAFGNGTIASGAQSTAGGLGSTASGNQSVALGNNVVVNGDQSLGMGINVLSTGFQSFSMGRNLNNNGNVTVLLGSDLSAETHGGVFMLGDGAATSKLLAGFDNQFSARFANGYRLFTNPDLTHGVFINGGSDGWLSVSDKRKKTNFETIDAESFLVKIDTMKIGSWNFKDQDPKTVRHYGPMAQDFYGAFGKDSYGTIGCDTLICSTDFDGINMISIKGLVTRTNELKKENASLQSKNTLLSDQLEAHIQVVDRLFKERESDQVNMVAMEARLRAEMTEEKLAMKKELNRILKEVRQSKSGATN